MSAPQGTTAPSRQARTDAGAAGRSRLGGFGAQFAARFAATQEAIAAIPRPVALAAAAILIVPAVLGFAAAAYVGSVQQKLELTLIGPDGAPDPVTALWWSNAADQSLVVGTRSGAMTMFDPAGRIRASLPGSGAAVVDIQAGADGRPAAITLSERQLSETPTGSLARLANFGATTCRTGYVWREDGGSEAVCVTPDSRDRAAEDNSVTAAGSAGCPEGRVPRAAFSQDVACATPEVAAQTLDENERNESRKLLPDAAFGGTRRVQLSQPGRAPLEGDRGLLVITDSAAITGQAVSLVADDPKQAAAAGDQQEIIIPVQWPLVDGEPARGTTVGTIVDIRTLARQPGTSLVYAGNGAGTVYEIDASAQMSSADPATYIRQLGSEGSPISAMAVASAPAENMPRLATGAEDGAITVWWPDVSPETGGSPRRSITSRGSTWTLQEQTVATAPPLLVKTASHGDALVFPSETALGMLTAPAIADVNPAAGAAGLTPPFAAAPDGRWSAGYDPQTRSVISYQGILRRPLRSIAAAQPPRDIAISPTGDRIAIVYADGSAGMVSLEGADDVQLGLPAQARSVAFNASGTQLAVGLAGMSAALYRASDGSLLDTVRTPARTDGADAQVSLDTQARFSGNGRRLVLLDLGRMASTYGIRMRQESDMQNIAVGEDLSEGRLTADGKRLVARTAGGPVIYDVATRAPIGSIVSMPFTTWAASPDASIIALSTTRGGTFVYVEQPDDAVAIPPPRLARDGLRLSADGSTLLLRDTDGRLHAWDLSDQARAAPLAADLAPDLTASAAELAPDGSFVVVADSTGGISLIDLRSRHRIGIAGHGSLVQHMLLSADGRLLASASIDGALQITDLVRARQMGALPLVTTLIGQRGRLQPALLADRPGSIDPAVQQFLESTGYGPVPTDGVLGIATRAAIARWQRDNARPPTGLPDEALLGAAAPPAQSRN